MDVKGILEKIKTDAHDAARQTLNEAQKSADELTAKSLARIDKQREDMNARIAQDGEEARKRIARMAELEDKKDLLAAKRRVIDEAFDEARGILLSMPAKEARAFFQAELLRAANGGEALVLGAEKTDWFDEAFLAEVNAALLARGIQKPVTLSDEKTAGRGFRLCHDGVAMDCTFDALLKDRRMALESDVAKLLFD